MACSICKQDGHNMITCPNKNKIIISDEKRDEALILRIDNMTEKEQTKMHTEIVKLKKRVTSSKAKATLIEAKSNELPSKIRDLTNELEKKVIENKNNE